MGTEPGPCSATSRNFCDSRRKTKLKNARHVKFICEAQTRRRQQSSRAGRPRKGHRALSSARLRVPESRSLRPPHTGGQCFPSLKYRS